ncbi:MAG: hypothetical protein K2L12_01555 [Clostridia bacterium]|nr:hypothetical protein [Clostridia bacterium]
MTKTEQNVTNETAEQNVTSETAVETVTEETAVTAVMKRHAVSGFKVRREKFKADDGREMWSYYIDGEVRHREVKVSFVAYDKGGAGYEFLDLIFDTKDAVDLVIYGETQKDFNGKVISKRTVYEVQDVDAVTGVVYSYKVKPYRETDKAYINIMLAEQAAKFKKDGN